MNRNKQSQSLPSGTNSADDFRKRQLFDDLYGRYQNDLRRYAQWLAGDRHIAEDLVQETLLRAWKSLDSLKSIGAAKGWLLTILRRENARRFERFQPIEVNIPVESLSAGNRRYDTSTEAFVVRKAINGLADEYRIPLMMQVIDGYSQREISQRIGISSAGVGTRLFRAREKLRNLLAA